MSEVWNKVYKSDNTFFGEEPSNFANVVRYKYNNTQMFQKFITAVNNQLVTSEVEEIYSEFQKLNVNVEHIKMADLRHEQLSLKYLLVHSSDIVIIKNASCL